MKIVRRFVGMHTQPDLSILLMEQLELLSQHFDKYSNSDRIFDEILNLLLSQLPHDFDRYNSPLVCIYEYINEILKDHLKKINVNSIINFYRKHLHYDDSDRFLYLSQLTYLLKLLNHNCDNYGDIVDLILDVIRYDPVYFLRKFILKFENESYHREILQKRDKYNTFLVTVLNDKQNIFHSCLIFYYEIVINQSHRLLINYNYNEYVFKLLLTLLAECLSSDNNDIVHKCLTLFQCYLDNYVAILPKKFLDWKISEILFNRLQSCCNYNTRKDNRFKSFEIMEFIVNHFHDQWQLFTITSTLIQVSVNDSFQKHMLLLFGKHCDTKYVMKMIRCILSKISVNSEFKQIFNSIQLVERFVVFVYYLKLRYKSACNQLWYNFDRIVLDDFLLILNENISHIRNEAHQEINEYKRIVSSTNFNQIEFDLMVPGDVPIHPLESLSEFLKKIDIVEFNLKRTLDLFDV